MRKSAAQEIMEEHLVESSPPISIDPDATGQLSYKVTANIIVSERTAFSLQTIGIIITVLVLLVAVAAVISRRRRKAAAPKPQPPPPPPQAAPYPAAGFCPNCGAPATPTSVFCRSCGSRLR